MGANFVWVTGLRCKDGHDLDLQSKVRHDYRGYPADAVPVDVAEDLRDRPQVCYRCYRANPDGPDLPMVGDATRYRVRFTGVPRATCEGCGGSAACGCYRVVSVEAEALTALPSCPDCGGSGWRCRACDGEGRRA